MLHILLLPLLLLATGSLAHPSSNVLPLPSEACTKGDVKFYSYHVHVIFDDKNDTSRAAALDFQREFAKTFNISVEVNGRTVAAPEFRAAQERPKCNSKVEIVSPSEIKLTWQAKEQVVSEAADAA